MPNYNYRARDMSGAVLSGNVFAEDEAALRNHLRNSRLFLVNFRSSLGSQERKQAHKKGGKKVKLAETVVACRQLATLVRAGLPIIETIATLRAQVENPSLIAAFTEIQGDIVGGGNLSSAMAKHPKIFSPLCVALTSAGEAGGILDQTLDIMAEQLDKESMIQQKIKAAMAYPKLVVAACFGVVAFMLVFIVPVFAKVYDQFHATLPATTLLLVTLSGFVTKFWWLAILMFYGAVKGFKAFRATELGTRVVDTVSLKVPLFGPLMRKIAIARFAQTFAGSTKSGIPILQALAVCADTAGNVVIHDGVIRVAAEVSDGGGLSTALENSGQFPPLVHRMVAAGEKSGNLDEMLEEIAKFYNRDVDFAVEKLAKLIEPMMTMVVGGIVLFVLLALYMPVFTLTQVMHR